MAEIDSATLEQAKNDPAVQAAIKAYSAAYLESYRTQHALIAKHRDNKQPDLEKETLGRLGYKSITFLEQDKPYFVSLTDEEEKQYGAVESKVFNANYSIATAIQAATGRSNTREMMPISLRREIEKSVEAQEQRVSNDATALAQSLDQTRLVSILTREAADDLKQSYTQYIESWAEVRSRYLDAPVLNGLSSVSPNPNALPLYGLDGQLHAKHIIVSAEDAAQLKASYDAYVQRQLRFDEEFKEATPGFTPESVAWNGGLKKSTIYDEVAREQRAQNPAWPYATVAQMANSVRAEQPFTVPYATESTIEITREVKMATPETGKSANVNESAEVKAAIAAHKDSYLEYVRLGRGLAATRRTHKEVGGAAQGFESVFFPPADAFIDLTPEEGKKLQAADVTANTAFNNIGTSVRTFAAQPTNNIPQNGVEELVSTVLSGASATAIAAATADNKPAVVTTPAPAPTKPLSPAEARDKIVDDPKVREATKATVASYVALERKRAELVAKYAGQTPVNSPVADANKYQLGLVDARGNATSQYITLTDGKDGKEWRDALLADEDKAATLMFEFRAAGSGLKLSQDTITKAFDGDDLPSSSYVYMLTTNAWDAQKANDPNFPNAAPAPKAPLVAASTASAFDAPDAPEGFAPATFDPSAPKAAPVAAPKPTVVTTAKPATAAPATPTKPVVFKGPYRNYEESLSLVDQDAGVKQARESYISAFVSSTRLQSSPDATNDQKNKALDQRTVAMRKITEAVKTVAAKDESNIAPDYVDGNNGLVQMAQAKAFEDAKKKLANPEVKTTKTVVADTAPLYGPTTAEITAAQTIQAANIVTNTLAGIANPPMQAAPAAPLYGPTTAEIAAAQALQASNIVTNTINTIANPPMQDAPQFYGPPAPTMAERAAMQTARATDVVRAPIQKIGGFLGGLLKPVVTTQETVKKAAKDATKPVEDTTKALTPPVLTEAEKKTAETQKLIAEETKRAEAQAKIDAQKQLDEINKKLAEAEKLLAAEQARKEADNKRIIEQEQQAAALAEAKAKETAKLAQKPQAPAKKKYKSAASRDASPIVALSQQQSKAAIAQYNADHAEQKEADTLGRGFLPPQPTVYAAIPASKPSHGFNQAEVERKLQELEAKHPGHYGTDTLGRIFEIDALPQPNIPQAIAKKNENRP